MVNDKGASIIGVTAGFLALSLVAVCLRCYVRLRIVKAFGWDDGIMVGAMVSLFTTVPMRRSRIPPKLIDLGAEYSFRVMRHHRRYLWHRTETVILQNAPGRFSQGSFGMSLQIPEL